MWLPRRTSPRARKLSLIHIFKVEEPSLDDAVAVIAGVKEYYENHHHVKVPDAIVRACVTLSERYITDRFLPDKAIDLLDEACACCNLRLSLIHI